MPAQFKVGDFVLLNPHYNDDHKHVRFTAWVSQVDGPDSYGHHYYHLKVPTQYYISYGGKRIPYGGHGYLAPEHYLERPPLVMGRGNYEE